MKIEGPRLELHPLKIEDIDNVMTWVNNPDIVKNFQNFKGFTREEELEYLRKMIASDNDRLFSIFRRSDGAYVGQCGINQISWQNNLGRLAITITPQHQGQKYFQEVIPLLIAHACRTLGLHKVWIMFYATNEKMWHLCDKLGFEFEAIKRRHYFWQGKYHDIIEMAIID